VFQVTDALAERLAHPDLGPGWHGAAVVAVAYTRKRVAEELRDYSNKLSAELRDRRERLARTEEKMRGLVDFIATLAGRAARTRGARSRRRRRSRVT
jgi:hypothetical protein